MSDRALERIQAIALVGMLVCAAHAFSGCGTAQVIVPAADQLRQIADDPVIRALPEAQRAAVVKAITQARSEVIQAKQQEQKEAGWAEFGRRVSFAIGGALAAIIAFVAIRIFR